jgi:hypothetical protein
MESILPSLSEAWNDFSLALALGILCVYFVADALYAHYTLSVAEYKPFAAANTGAFLHFLLALGVLSYVENYLYVVPIAIGSWLGTYVLVVLKSQSKIKTKPCNAQGFGT